MYGRSKLNKKRSEQAVSPVVGVMLMLVITVLLAAAVSAFTGGIKTQKAAPSAKFDVKIVKKESSSMGGWVTYMQITEVSGDTIPSKNLEIITYNPDAVGNKYMKVIPDSSNTHYYQNYNCTSWFSWGYPLRYYFNGIARIQDNTTVKVITTTTNTTTNATVPLYVFERGWNNGTSPYLNNVAQGYFGHEQKLVNNKFYDVIKNITFIVYYKNATGNITTTQLSVKNYNFTNNSLELPASINASNVTKVKEILTWIPDNTKVDFGNYAVHPGVTLTADWYDNYPQAPWGYNKLYRKYMYLGSNVTGFCACIADGWNVTPGHYVTVKIIYTPTHTVIWEKKVLVRGEGVW